MFKKKYFQVKSPSIWSRVPETGSDPPIGSDRDSGCDRQFLGHVGFYKRFIMDFSKTAKPLYKLLEKDAKFIWDADCQKSFEELKAFFTTAPIVRAPNWQLPFEVMCNASDLAIGAVLGQREEGTEELHNHRKGAAGSGLCLRQISSLFGSVGHNNIHGSFSLEILAHQTKC